METINIVFSSDNNYAQYMGVAICSIFENKKNTYIIDIYVLDGGINEDNKNKLKVLEDKYHFVINYIEIDTNFFKDFFISKHLSQATYYRLMVPEILINLDKILYLDCDIVIINDIYHLYKTNIDDYFLAGVDDILMYQGRKDVLGIPKNEKYLNTGVILINLEKWRKYNTKKQIIDYIKQNPEKLEFCDQDAVNAILYGKWLNMPVIYNYISELFNYQEYKYADFKKHIVVIHYAGLKPWNYLYICPLKSYYFKYLKKTPWRNIKYKNKTFKNIIIKCLENLILMLPDSLIKSIKNVKNKLKIKFY